MINRDVALKIRKTHRYLGLFIGIQFLAWTISGLYFSWTDLDKIHGDQFIRVPPNKAIFSNLIPLDSLNESIIELDLVNIAGKPYYWINNDRLYNAKIGTIKNGITKKEAITIAQENLIEGLKLDHVEYLTETNPHHEYRGQSLPAYAIHFKNKDLLVAYVDAKSGIFKKVRHQSWRWFDFLWMGHTMDYKGRDNFNNILLRIFSLFGVFTVLSGFVLWGTSSSTIIRFLNRKS